MRPDPRDLHRRAVQRAGVLSRSGGYAGWQEVQDALLAEGFAEARIALRPQYLREMLTNDCIKARRIGTAGGTDRGEPRSR